MKAPDRQRRLANLRTLAEDLCVPQRTLVEASRRGDFCRVYRVSQRLYLYDLDELERWLRSREVSPTASTFNASFLEEGGATSAEADAAPVATTGRSRRNRQSKRTGRAALTAILRTVGSNAHE